LGKRPTFQASDKVPIPIGGQHRLALGGYHGVRRPIARELGREGRGLVAVSVAVTVAGDLASPAIDLLLPAAQRLPGRGQHGRADLAPLALETSDVRVARPVQALHDGAARRARLALGELGGDLLQRARVVEDAGVLFLP
jgi:hypothetical protein